jgi:hypothetical protein
MTTRKAAGLRSSSYLLVSDFERLEEWCRLVDVVFDHHTTYLVGSVLTKPDFRDVDLRCILPDAVFDRWWKDRLKVRYVNRAISIWGQKETGLPIDFQVQRQTEANEQFPGANRRNPMGFRDWALTPTSGVPR